MPIYFEDSLIPELANLTKRQRRIVVRGAAALFRRERPSDRWKIGLPGSIGAVVGMGIGAALAQTIPENSTYRLVVVFGCGLIMGVIGGAVGAQLFINRLRPYFQRFIAEHGDELSRPS